MKYGVNFPENRKQELLFIEISWKVYDFGQVEGSWIISIPYKHVMSLYHLINDKEKVLLAHDKIIKNFVF